MKRNNLVLLIVTITIFVVLLIGATYAYFASNTNVGNGLEFSATLDDNNIAFTATSGSLSLHVAAENMLQSQTGSGDVIAAQQTGDNNINITLSSNTEAPIACTYNIYFQWNNGQAYLNPTVSNKNEFTLELDLQDSDGTGSEGTNKFASETQLTRVITNTNKTIVVEGASIVGSSADSGSQTWVPTAKFYNLTDDQSALAGKIFGGKFTIEDVECNAVASNSSGAIEGSLAHAVLSKVSDDEYTSSQDGTVYKIKNTDARMVAEDATYTKVTDYGSYIMYETTSEYGDRAFDTTVFTKASDGTWSNTPSMMEDSEEHGDPMYFNLSVEIIEEAHYEFCYSLGPGGNYDALSVFLSDALYNHDGSVEIFSVSASRGTDTKNGCQYIGYLTPEYHVRIVNSTFSNTASAHFIYKKLKRKHQLMLG